MSVHKKQTILLLGTGGTIAGLAPDARQADQYAAGVLSIEAVLAAMPSAGDLTTHITVLSRQIFNIDSKDIDFSQWRELALACEDALIDCAVDAIVIAHGTDTIEETAYFLSRVLNVSKPIILTCAMRPANAPDADGPANLLHSLHTAKNALEQGLRGVVLAAADVVWSARDVEKMHPRKVNAFSSRDSEQELVSNTGHTLQNPTVWMDAFTTSAPVLTAKQLPIASNWPWVEIVLACAGASPHGVNALVQAGVQGLVVAATGNGTLHSQLEKALLKAVTQGVWVWRSSRCGLGLLKPDAVAKLPSMDLSPVKARIEMLLHILRTHL